MQFNNPLPRATQPRFAEGTALASNRDDRNNSKIWIKAQSNVKQDNRGQEVIKQLMRKIQNLRHVRAGAYLPTVQTEPFHPFKIYQPTGTLPPTGVIFDASANPLTIAIDSTVPTNLPTTINPNTDRWRIFAVRNGVVETRDYVSIDFGFTNGNSVFVDMAASYNFSYYAFGNFGTDGVSPFLYTESSSPDILSDSLEYDSPKTSIPIYPGLFPGEPAQGGQVLIYGGTGADISNSFAVWIDAYEMKIRAKDDADLSGLNTQSPYLISVGLVVFNNKKNTIQQILFDNALSRFTTGMYSPGNAPTSMADIQNGGLSFRGYWTVDNLSGQVFYDGDVVVDDSFTTDNFYVASSSGGATNSLVHFYGQWLYIGGVNIESTSPANDPTNWLKIGSVKL